MTNTVVAPGSDSAVLRVRGTNKALAMTTDCNARYLYLDPEKGGAIAVAEAARNIVASGGKPLAITDCLNFGNPEKPEQFWELTTAADGISRSCLALDTPVISGNVSLYNETNGSAILPTPMIGMVGLIEDVKNITTQEFKKAGDLIVLVGQTFDDFSGSELQKMLTGEISGTIDFDLETEKSNQDFVLKAITDGLVSSAHDLAEGGLAIALAESAFANCLGVDVKVNLTNAQLFSETQAAFEKLLTESSVSGEVIGKVTDSGILEMNELSISTDEAVSIYEGALPCLMK